MYILANVAASAASQRFGAPDDASAGRGRSYAQTRSPGWTSAFRELLRSMRRAAPVVDPSSQAASCAAVAARMRARVGGVRWGGGASLHAALAHQLHGMDTSDAPRAQRKIPNSGFKRQEATLRNFHRAAKLAEIGSSLISPKNSSRKFQTHISNSDEQIPKHARQNSEDCRFPVSRNKVRSRGHRFIGTDFSILVSEFKFPPLSRIWDASHFSFLDSRCKSKDAHGVEIAQFQFLISRFTILVSKREFQKGPCTSQTRRFLISHFSFLVSKEPSFHGI